MAKKRLYAHVVLDRSGSMESCRDSTIDAFNEYVNGLALNDDISARISLTIFDSKSVDIIHDNVKAKEMPKLTRETFVPCGMTPLNDAIGKTVAKIDSEARREGERVALVILTDGMENASTEYDKDAIKKLIAGRQKDKGWLVLYLGANQDAWAEGAARGTVFGHSMGFGVRNIGAAMGSARRMTAEYAVSGEADAVAFSEEERAAAKADDAAAQP